MWWDGFLARVRLLRFGEHTSAPDEHSERMEFCSGGHLCSTQPTAEGYLWWQVGGRVGRGIFTCLHREATNPSTFSLVKLILENPFGSCGLALWVPFLSTGPIQTHRSWADAAKEDAEFHTALCWVCKNFTDLSKLPCWETKLKQNKNP